MQIELSLSDLKSLRVVKLSSDKFLLNIDSADSDYDFYFVN